MTGEDARFATSSIVRGHARTPDADDPLEAAVKSVFLPSAIAVSPPSCGLERAARLARVGRERLHPTALGSGDDPLGVGGERRSPFRARERGESSSSWRRRSTRASRRGRERHVPRRSPRGATPPQAPSRRGATCRPSLPSRIAVNTSAPSSASAIDVTGDDHDRHPCTGNAPALLCRRASRARATRCAPPRRRRPRRRTPSRRCRRRRTRRACRARASHCDGARCVAPGTRQSHRRRRERLHGAARQRDLARALPVDVVDAQARRSLRPRRRLRHEATSAMAETDCQLPSQRRLSPVTLAIFCWFCPCGFER